MSAGAIKPGAGSRPGIVGVGETPMLRHPEPGCSTAGLLARAIGLAWPTPASRRARWTAWAWLVQPAAGPRHRPGLAVGPEAEWCMQDEMGGASAINLLRQAWLALEAGQARTIVLAAGDHFAGFSGLGRDYNRSARGT